MAGGVLLLCVLALAGLYWMRGRGREASFQMERLIRLTATGKAARVAISPDGKEVLYSFLDAGQESLRLRQVDTGGEIETLPPEKVTYYGMTFSPDGALVYYTRGEANASVSVLYQSTKYGGSPRRLCANVDSPIGFSPDGRRIAFVRQSGRDRQLMVADSTCGGERVLAVRRQPDGFRLRGPAWSPDGKWIAVATENLTRAAFQTFVGVRVADGAETPLTAQTWEYANQAAWLPDRSGLLFVATEPLGYQNQLWSQAWPKGQLRRITKDLNGYAGLSISADVSRIATVQSERFMSIWVAPEGDANRAVRITTGAQRDDGIRGLAWTSDGRIVYRSFAGGNPNVWIMKADGSENRQLSTSAHQNTDPMVSPDGSYIAWSSDRIGLRNIWRMNLDGGSVRQLTRGAGEWFPQVTPDDKWLVYQALAQDELDRLIWKMPLDGGAPVRLTDFPSYAPVLSPDGKLIVCNYRERPEASVKTAVLSIDGGPPLRTFDLPGANLPDRPVRWTPDGGALAYIKVDDGVSNIWSQPWRGGPPKQLTFFKSEEILNFAWSRDGKQLALARGVTVSDVVLISSQK
jgi:Tol biopolymer transport system component